MLRGKPLTLQGRHLAECIFSQCVAPAVRDRTRGTLECCRPDLLLQCFLMQFLVCGVGSGIPALIFEKPQIPSILAAWQPILYAGALSCGVAYTLQIIGQKNLDPTIASLIMSLESCISVLAGWVILGQSMSARELLGCAVMFASIILAQLPGGRELQVSET